MTCFEKHNLVAASVMALLFLVNPLALQGCFLRCPELQPYDYSRDIEPATNNLTRTYTAESKEGVLELQLSDVRLFPAIKRQYGNLTEPVGDSHHALSNIHLISPAYATPSCQTHEPPPAKYEVIATLEATWIPAEGDAVVLLEEFLLYGELDASDAKSGKGYLDLKARTSSTTSSLKLVPGQDGFSLESSKLATTHDGKQWDIVTSSGEVSSITIEE